MNGKLTLLFALSSLFLFSNCKEETLTEEFSKITNQKESGFIPKGYSKINPIGKDKIKGIKQKADDEYLKFKEIILNNNMKFNDIIVDPDFPILPDFPPFGDIPHWVGVMPIENNCPIGTPEIRYYMDTEDTNPQTRWKESCCFKPKGLRKAGKNLYWVVCIIDAKKHNFTHINKSYAIFDLSHIQHLNNANEVMLRSDDEDDRNSNHYDCPSYGFVRNPNLYSYPTQHLDRNTTFWFYYFKKKNTSVKLPNLGFEYFVFSNFTECDWTNQNVLYCDTEDDAGNLNLIIDYPPNQNSRSVVGDFLDPEYKIFYIGQNIEYYVQSASVYQN